MNASTADSARGVAASMPAPTSWSSTTILFLVARRHVDLHRVSSALCLQH